MAKAKKDAPVQLHPMTRVLATFRRPDRTGFEDAWIGMEPTFQTRKSIRRWAKMSADEAGEDAYFLDRYMLRTEKAMADDIEDRFRAKRRKGKAYCMFDRVERFEELDQWKVKRQALRFHWADRNLPHFAVKFALDPETFEYSIKPVPLAWFYDEDFVRFLEELVWGVPMAHGLTPSIAHGGAQFSMSAKTVMVGSLLADDIATRLNHPELSTFMMDWPNPDDRPLRATRRRFEATRSVLEQYWAGAFHPRALGPLTAENAYLDRGFLPCPSPPKGLVDPRKGPTGSARDVFQTNFAFGRAVRWLAQNVHPGYWQAAHPAEVGYRPDQIMRYSEINLNRLQIAGEFHVKSGDVLDAERVPELDAPLDISMLYDEASYEFRGQMGRTSARDYVEAVLLDMHSLRHLAAHPHVKVQGSLLQDQLHGDGEETIRKHGGDRLLGRLRREARAENLEAGRQRVKSDFIEPETLFWEAWRVLPAGGKAAVAREAIGGFVERVEAAAAVDPRPQARSADPMEWHRHRVHPCLWKAVEGVRMKGGDPVRRERDLWRERRKEYLARRPVFSQVRLTPPWDEE